MNEQARALRTWVMPKKCQIHTLKLNIALLEFRIEQIKVNVKDGWFLEQAKKAVKEAPTDFLRKKEELNLKQLKSDLESDLIGRDEEIQLEELNMQLKIEEKSLQEFEKKIIQAERNHKVEEKPKPNPKNSETHAGGTAEKPEYKNPHADGRLPPKPKEEVKEDDKFDEEGAYL